MKKRFTIGIAVITILIISLIATFVVSKVLSRPIEASADLSEGISIAYARDVQPFHFTDSEGNPAGIMVDMWNLWSDKTGIPIEFKEATWNETLRIVGSGEADVHAGLFYSEERDEFLDYGISFIDTETHVFRHKSLPQINDVIGLSAYRVGVLKGDYVESYLRESLPEENLVPYSTYEDMMEALKEGFVKVFAADTPTGLYLLKQNGMLSDFLYESEKSLYREKWHVASKEGEGALLNKVNEGFSQISEEERTSIERKWTWSESSDEGTLIIGISRSFEPLAFINSLGQPSGLFVDIWREWSRITGRPVEFKGSSWTETLEGLNSGSIDIHSGLSYSADREELFDFSSQIYSTHTQVYHRPDEKQPENIEGYGEYIVGIQYGTYMDSEFRKYFPEIRVRNYSTGQDLIRALLDGEVKALIHESHLMNGQLDRLGLSGSVATRDEKLFPSTIHSAVRKGDSDLLKVINDGFSAISSERLAVLEERWIPDSSDRIFTSDSFVPDSRIILTEKELSWLKSHPIITLGGPDVPPLDFVDENGRAAGIGPDYVDLVGQILGIRFEYVTDVWSNIHEMAEKKEIDGIRILVKTEDRKSYLNFSESYTPFEYAIIIANDSPGVGALQELSGKSLAVLDASFDQNYVMENYPDVKLLPMDTYEEGLRAVFNGEADAFLGAQASASYQIQTKMLYGLKVSATVKELSNDLYMAVRKDWPEFIPILNKALGSITPEQHREIKSKWFALSPDEEEISSIALTEEERAFLKANPVIRVHNEMNWPPYNYNEGGVPQGYSIDYCNLVAEKAGFEVEYQSGPSWGEFMNMAGNREIDIMLNIARNDERETFLEFSSPYITLSQRIVHRSGTVPFKRLSDLKGKKVAMVEGFFTTSFLRENHPGIEQVLFPDALSALIAVARGEADAHIGEFAVSIYLIEKNRITDLVVSPPLDSSDFPATDLHFAVRKDWKVLAGILDKAMAEISMLERAGLQQKWFLKSTDESRQIEESSLLSSIIQISIMVLVFLVVLFGIYFLTKQIFRGSEGKIDQFSSGKMRSLGLVILFILVTAILAMAYFGLNSIRNRNVTEFKKYMVSLLENTENSLNIWIGHNLNQLESVSRDPELIRMVESQLAENRTAESLLKSEALAELREYFQKRRVEFENEGFFVISPDRVNIASRRDENLGLINLIEEQRPGLLEDVFQGQSRFIPPIRSDVSLRENDNELPPTMFYAVPLFNEAGEVIAALTLRDVPMNEFSRFCEQVRIGESGETYAFDDRGLLLSMSRFDDDLIQSGLLDEGQISLLNIAIAEPDGNRPFTYMMQNAIERRDGENFEGYRDYRGREVFGVWKWNNSYGFGLTTEIDAEEALATYYTIRFVLIAILLVTLLMAMGATVLSIIIGQKANSALTKANDELEDRVESRTAQLKKSEERSQSLLEAAPDGMVIVNERHVIVQVNNQTEKMFGYSRDELIGEEIEILVPEMKREAHVSQRESYIADPSTRAMGAIMEILAQRKDGSTFPADIGLSPIRTEEGLLVVSSVRDITERKRAEDDLRKLSTAVEQSPVSLVITDKEGNIEYVNPRFEITTGYSSEEAIGKNPRILNAREQSSEFYDDLWKTISSGNVWEGEFCNLRKNGEKYWESASIAPIKRDKGEITHYVAIKEDITAQKQAREELALLHQLVFGSLESADIGAWWVDFNEEDTFHALDTTVKLIGMAANDSGDKSYKISDWGEILTKTGVLNPEYQKMIDNTFEQFTGAISGKYEAYNATYPVVQLDGSVKWIVARAEVPQRKEDGSALLMTGTLIDITEIKLSQDQLNRQKNDAELIQQVTEIASVTDSTETSLSKCLATICRSTSWPVGHVYVPSNIDRSVLIPSRIWYLSDENHFETFKAATEKTSFKLGEGLPGRVWEAKEPAWIKNVHKDINFPRNKLVSDLGVKGAFGFPIFLQDELVAVCEFFTIQEMEPDRQLLSNMKSIGDQIGRVFERNAAEEEIRQINSLSDNALDLTRSGFWKIDYSDPDCYISSKRAADIFGEPYKEDWKYDLSSEWLDRIIEADREIADQTGKNYSDAVKGLIPRYDATYPYKRPADGKIVWIRAIGHVLRDNDGNAVSMHGVAQDITDVYEAEQEIRKQHDQLLKIIEELPIPAAQWELEGKMIHINGAMTDLLGYTIEDLPTIDAHWEKFYPDPHNRAEYKKVWIEFLEEASKTGMAVKPLMMNVTTREGELKNLLSHTIQIGDMALTMWVDFTERENYEKLLEDIFDSVPTSLSISDLDSGEVLKANQASADFSGMTMEELMSHKISEHYVNPHRDRPLLIKAFKERKTIEVELKRLSTEEPRWCLMNGTIIDYEGRKALLGSFTDISELKEIQSELARAKDTAESATRAKSDFLANMSHEIRTPMNAIIGLSHLIQKTDLSRKQEDYIQKISGSAHNLLGIINDILDFSKIEAGKLTMESIDFNLNEVFDNLGSMMGNKTRDKGLELIFDIATDIPPNLVGDPLRLGQILLNLTNNAVKFTEKGEIVVSVELEEKDQKEAFLRFKVRDTGIGLTEEQAGNLFQAFTQADTSTTRKFGGTGLGLSISKKLSEMMGGTIGVESVYGEGATFFFTGVFQYRKAKKREVLPEEIRNLNVLIVDDNATSREVLTAYARDFSFSSVAVENGQEAIRLIREVKEEKKDPFDLILMDYMMPGLNGYETAGKINELLVEAERPKYILVTSYGRDEILDAVEDAGFGGFILKPINQSIMFNTIVEAFGLASEEDKRKTGEKFPDGFDLIRGASVLLAEDNEINQQVAKEVLEGEGFFVDIANNGHEAVDMNRNKGYDIILMDLQMPILDGYKATEEIRKDETYKDLSIVAMTADAMTGVRDNVIEIGMNDYITKPIDTSQLWKTLVQWIEPGERKLPDGFEEKAELEAVEMELHPVDGIDVAGGLMRVGGNKKLYTDLLKRFVSDFNDFESDIVNMLSDDKTDEAVRLAHTLKGVSANLGVEVLSDKAALLELAIKDNIEVENRLQALCIMLKTTIGTIESSGNIDRGKDKASKSKSFSAEEIRAMLTAAVESMKKRKPVPAQEIFDELNDSDLPEELSALLEKCGKLLESYKMKDAVKLIEDILGRDNV